MHDINILTTSVPAKPHTKEQQNDYKNQRAAVVSSVRTAAERYRRTTFENEFLAGIRVQSMETMRVIVLLSLLATLDARSSNVCIIFMLFY